MAPYTEESNLLVTTEARGSFNCGTFFGVSGGCSLASHFLIGFLGVVVGSTMVHRMETTELERKLSMLMMAEKQAPLLGHPKSSSPFTKEVVAKGNWIENFGISRGVLTTTNGQRHLFASGQSPFDGETVQGSDMRSQTQVVVKFIDTTLESADMDVCDIVRITVFTTDTDSTLGSWDVLQGWWGHCSVKPASTLVGVASLFSPEAYVEIEVEAVN